MNNPWERLPAHETGDVDDKSTYEAVGRALSQWEILETFLANLFSVFVENASNDDEAAVEHFRSIPVTGTRFAKLEAAAKEYFVSRNGNHRKAFEELFVLCRNLADRRNEIAHGCVMHMQTASDRSSKGYFLTPAFFLPLKFQSLDPKYYRYRATEILHYRDQFEIATAQAGELIIELRPRPEPADSSSAG